MLGLEKPAAFFTVPRNAKDSPGDSMLEETWEQRQRRLDEEQLAFIEAHFRSVFPDTFSQVVPVFKHQELDYLMYQWDETVGQLDRMLEVYKRTGKRRKVSVGPFDNLFIGSCVAWWGPGFRFCCCLNILCGWLISRCEKGAEQRIVCMQTRTYIITLTR